MRFTASLLLFVLLSLLAGPASARENGIEVSLTVSGRLILGFQFRFHFDEDTALRIGASMGVTGAPVGVQVGMLQFVSPVRKWGPYFGIGYDALYTSLRADRRFLWYARSMFGMSYSPHRNLAHQSELWLAYFPKSMTIRPLGISFLHFNSVW